MLKFSKEDCHLEQHYQEMLQTCDVMSLEARQFFLHCLYSHSADSFVMSKFESSIQLTVRYSALFVQGRATKWCFIRIGIRFVKIPQNLIIALLNIDKSSPSSFRTSHSSTDNSTNLLKQFSGISPRTHPRKKRLFLSYHNRR